jgi:polyisoprenoid-binding protein YceI/rhodanese-related sulfurtransferase
MQTEESYDRISPEELHRWVTEGRDMILIDTLPSEHYEKVHLPESRNACVYQVTFPDQVQAIVAGREADIVVYGSSDASMDAATAAEKLTRLGYEKVHALKGGLTAWRNAGYPLAGQDPGAVDDATAGLSFEDGLYQVDTEQSLVEWAGRNPNVKHYGTIGLTEGAITLKDGEMGGTFEIDMGSIKNMDLEGDPLQPVLIRHLMSDDFFFVERFPKGVFTIQSGKPGEAPTLTSPNYRVSGLLELRGVRHEIHFPVTLSRLTEGGITAEAHFDMDRTRWNIIYGSSRFYEHLGMHAVFDPISFQLRIVAAKR